AGGRGAGRAFCAGGGAGRKKETRRRSGSAGGQGITKLRLLHAAARRVRPLVLEAEAGVEERRRAPGALVVGLVAVAVEPRVEVRIGDRLARLVAGEGVEVLRVGEADAVAAAAARVRHRGVLCGAERAGECRTVRAAVEGRAAGRGAGAV